MSTQNLRALLHVYFTILVLQSSDSEMCRVRISVPWLNKEERKGNIALNLIYLATVKLKSANMQIFTDLVHRYDSGIAFDYAWRFFDLSQIRYGINTKQRSTTKSRNCLGCST